PATLFYSLSLHDALPIWDAQNWRGRRSLAAASAGGFLAPLCPVRRENAPQVCALRGINGETSSSLWCGSFALFALSAPPSSGSLDRKSTRLNSSHDQSSY